MAEKDNEKAKDEIDAGRAAPGSNTATGQEAARRSGEEDESLPEGEERGSTVAIEGEFKGDYLGKPNKAQGAQKEEAEFVSNGTIPLNHVPSNSGLVPVSALANSPEDAERRLEEQRKSLDGSRKALFSQRAELTEEQISRMGGAELRAVATDRGYDIPDNIGARGTRAAFARAQADDDSIQREG